MKRIVPQRQIEHLSDLLRDDALLLDLLGSPSEPLDRDDIRLETLAEWLVPIADPSNEELLEVVLDDDVQRTLPWPELQPSPVDVAAEFADAGGVDKGAEAEAVTSSELDALLAAGTPERAIRHLREAAYRQLAQAERIEGNPRQFAAIVARARQSADPEEEVADLEASVDELHEFLDVSRSLANLLHVLLPGKDDRGAAKERLGRLIAAVLEASSPERARTKNERVDVLLSLESDLKRLFPEVERSWANALGHLGVRLRICDPPGEARVAKSYLAAVAKRCRTWKSDRRKAGNRDG